MRRAFLLGIALASLAAGSGCKRFVRSGMGSDSSANAAPSSTTTTTLGEVAAAPDPVPAPGKGNLKGVVRFDGKPVANIDVRLCESFSSMSLGGGCAGRTFDAKTNESGQYIVRDVPPLEYGALLVFEPESNGRYQYQAPAHDFVGAQKHTVRANATSDAGVTNLFRTNLHLHLPRAAQRTTSTPEIRWSAYPGATRYVVSLSRPYDAKEETSIPINESVETTSFTPKAALAPGRWELVVRAESTHGKLAETTERLLFIVDDEHAQTKVAPAPLPAKRPPAPTFQRVTPASGMGALQGAVVHDDRPAAGIEVKLCETFDPWFSGCGGKILTTKTNTDGVYVFTDLAPREYQGLTARVFKTSDVIYVTSGLASSKTYKVEADQTLVPPATNLFKNDVRIVAPSARVKPGAFEVKWAPYPNAAFYKFTISRDGGDSPPYSGFRVDEPRFLLDKPLSAGSYHLTVQAFNASGTKLAENGSGGKFTVK